MQATQHTAKDQAHDAAPDYAILRWLVGATFVVILNETIMINAIPRLMVDFAVNANAAQWLSTAFMLTMAVVIPITGWFLQRVTTRFAFGLAMGTFCAGTLLAACAWTFPVLLVARVVQAGGTAVMMPLLMTTLMAVVPMHDRGRVMGNVTLAMSVAPALGPAVSGVILSSFSWRWIFLFVLPIAAAIGIFGYRKLINVGEPVASSVDWLSVVIAAIGFGSLVYGLSEVGVPGDHTPAYAALVVGVAGVASFVWRQLFLQRSDRPLLDLRTLRFRVFSVSLGVMAFAFMAMLGSMILLQLYLQNVRGMTPTGDRDAGDAGWSGDGSARPPRGAGLRRARCAGPGHPGRDRLGGLDGYVRRDRLGDGDLADHGCPRRADGQPGCAVHAGVHHGSGLAAGTPLLARQLASRHDPAGGRRHGHRSRGDRHVQPRDLAGRRRGRPADCLAGGPALGLRRLGRALCGRARAGVPAPGADRRPRGG